MRVRPADPKDLPEIVEIERLCFPEETAFPPEMFAYLIRYAKVLVASDEVIRGFIIGFASGHTGVIYTLDVHPNCRRMGIGSLLTKSLEQEFSSQGVMAIRLEAALENPAALNLYRKAGYRDTELLLNYYAQGKDAARMWKELS